MSPSDAFAVHVRWLKEMRHEYENSFRSEEHFTEHDGHEPDYYPTYRSLLDLSLDDNHPPAEDQSTELDFSEPIYRSAFPCSGEGADDADAPAAEEASKAWVAQERPPLIKRQRGFNAGRQ